MIFIVFGTAPIGIRALLIGPGTYSSYQGLTFGFGTYLLEQ